MQLPLASASPCAQQLPRLKAMYLIINTHTVDLPLTFPLHLCYTQAFTPVSTQLHSMLLLKNVQPPSSVDLSLFTMVQSKCRSSTLNQLPLPSSLPHNISPMSSLNISSSLQTPTLPHSRPYQKLDCPAPPFPPPLSPNTHPKRFSSTTSSISIPHFNSPTFKHIHQSTSSILIFTVFNVPLFHLPLHF